MPTYEYECDACSHKFDEYQNFSEPVLTRCPKCGKKKLRRLFGTGTAVIFKGSGFYETDYRSESYKSAAKADAEASKSSPDSSKSGTTDKTGSESKSSESKPAGKSTKSAK
jgi:putative FmdB family regulatory protein